MSSQVPTIRKLHRRSEVTAAGKTPKVPQACEECRRRRQKCDGRSPCRICAKRHASCSYRVSSSGKSAKASSDHHSRVDQNSASLRACQATPLRKHIFNNIRATNDASGTELFYGASSNFSLLQHLNVHFPTQTSIAPSQAIIANGVQDGGESIKRYNYQSLAFDSLIPRVQRVDSYALISYDMAKTYLRNFLLTAAHRNPFLESVRLCSALETLYASGDDNFLRPLDRSVLIISLAVGATSSTDSPNRQHLIAQARAEAESALYDISLKAVQVALLMAQCEFDAGNSNLCYLQLGGAIRKAFAAGVHRANSLEAKHTMWALFCNESLICLMLGRQSTLEEDDIIVLPPERESYIGSFVRLCIIVRSAYRIYRSDNTSMVADLDVAHSVSRQLSEFSDMLRKDLDLDIGGQIYALTGEKLSWHITISYQLKRRHASVRRETVSDMETTRLAEASLVCIRSAESIVTLSDSLFSLHIGLEGSYNHGFYLESACFVLVLAVAYDMPTPCDNLSRVRKGLQLMHKLGEREPIQSIVSALEQMLDRVTAVPTQSAPDHTHDVIPGREGWSLSTVTGLQEPSSHSVSAFVDHSTLGSESHVATPHDGDVLEELWSMMDWSLEFPLLDPGFPVTARET